MPADILLWCDKLNADVAELGNDVTPVLSLSEIPEIDSSSTKAWVMLGSEDPKLMGSGIESIYNNASLVSVVIKIRNVETAGTRDRIIEFQELQKKVKDSLISWNEGAEGNRPIVYLGANTFDNYNNSVFWHMRFLQSYEETYTVRT